MHPAGSSDQPDCLCRGVAPARIRPDRRQGQEPVRNHNHLQLGRHPEAELPAQAGRAGRRLRLRRRRPHDHRAERRLDRRLIAGLRAQPARDRGRESQSERHPFPRRPRPTRAHDRARRPFRAGGQVRPAGARQGRRHSPPGEPRAAGHGCFEQGRVWRSRRRNRLRQRRRDQRQGEWHRDPGLAERHRRLPDRNAQRSAEQDRRRRVHQVRAIEPGTGDPRRRRIREGLSRARIPAPLMALAVAGLLLFLLPLAGLVARAPWDQVGPALVAPETATALGLSLFCSVTATAIALVLGIPLALLLARTSGAPRAILRALTTLPMVLPPVVGGVALWLPFGRRGLGGGPPYNAFGIQIPFTTPAAVSAQTFLALPLLVIAVQGGLRALDAPYEEAARALGAGRWKVFSRVTLPLVRPAIFSRAVLRSAPALR